MLPFLSLVLKRSTGRPGHIAAATSALMIAQQVAGKAARDALFLTSFHVSSLPFAMASGALLSLASVWLLSRLMAKHAPAQLAPALFATSALAFGLEAVVQVWSAPLAAWMLYLHTAFLGPVAISAFWSLINERFDPHGARRVVAHISDGGTLGGVLGALAAWRLSTVLRPEAVLACLGLVNGAAALGALRSGKYGTSELPAPEPQAASVEPSSEAPTGLGASFRTLRGVSLLRNLALLVAIGALTSALLDYVFSTEAVAHFGKGQALLSFFSLFWLAVGIVSFLIQISLGRLVEKLSLALNIAILPGIILTGGALGLAVPGLMSSALLRGGEAVQRNTLFRSAYELFFTPIEEGRKRLTKSLIDIGFDRLGTVFGSGVVLLTLRLAAPRAPSYLLGGVVVLALLTFPLVRRLHVGYVATLQASLKEAEQKLAPTSQAAPRLGNEPLTEPPQARDKLIERLEQVQPGGLTVLLDPNSPAAPPVPQPSPSPRDDPRELLGVAQELTSKDPSRIQSALERLTPRDPGVACALELLAERQLARQVSAALSKIGPAITGQLIDALLDPATSFSIRRRLPRVIQSCLDQRAADGLLLGLDDERFEVRYECGRALFRLTDADPRIRISLERTVAAITQEVRRAGQLMNEEFTESDDDSPEEPQTRLMEGLRRDRINRVLEHVFQLLCLHLEREPLCIAFRALHVQDERFRGTALEYLSVVLPEEVRELLWPYLGVESPLPRARPVQELLSQLVEAGAAPQA